MRSPEEHEVVTAFRRVLQEKNIDRQTIIVGVSGGVDSMTMLALFVKFQINVYVAHINYHLRGKDSDEDELLVTKFCKSHHLPLEVYHFDKEIHKKKGQSLQMAARVFRYEKFNELKIRHRAAFIALAHHLDDYVETFFLNLTRGSGLNGLLQENDDSIFIRPLSEVRKDKIIDFALKNSISWRDDYSNTTDAYERNRIRNVVLPALYSLHPRVFQGILHTIHNLRSAQRFIRYSASEYIKLQKKILYHGFIISLKPLNPWRTEYRALLQQILKQEQIPVNHIDDLLKSFQSSEAKIWNIGYPLVFTRDSELYVYPDEHRKSKVEVYLNWTDVSSPCEIPDWGVIEITSKEADIWLVQDIEKTTLQFRPWLVSDYIYLKNGGRKKVSSILKDRKLTIVQRNKVLVMTSDSEVVWIVGIQADARYTAEWGTGLGMKARCYWL